MDFDRALFHAELDARSWASYTHAYGSAEDVPGCLRALAGDDDAAAEEALSELYSSILHQGSVYEASAKAVPFLARIAAAGIRTVDVLLLIGGIAEGGTDPDPGAEPEPGPAGSEAVRESDEAACRRAVVAHLPLLLASVEHEDRAVRQAAAWAAGWTGTAGAALAVPAAVTGRRSRRIPSSVPNSSLPWWSWTPREPPPRRPGRSARTARRSCGSPPSWPVRTPDFPGPGPTTKPCWTCFPWTASPPTGTTTPVTNPCTTSP
ncbi:hypothetical protein [Streptomyces sp. NPDC045714]|uniref:hypothetical protein n=1 Tax=Streptomyces sp. NPDC045714 TaxID=3154913 RepID=UPI0033DB4688